MSNTSGVWRAHGGVQGGRGVPGLEADAADEIADRIRGGERHFGAVAGKDEAFGEPAGDMRLEAFDGAIDVADGAAGGGFFAEDVPGFEGVAQFEGCAMGGDVADFREAEGEMGFEPGAFEAGSRAMASSSRGAR